MEVHKLYHERFESIQSLASEIDYLPKAATMEQDAVLEQGIKGTIFLLESLKQAQLMRLKCYDTLIHQLPEIMKMNYTIEKSGTVNLELLNIYRQHKEKLDELIVNLAELEQIEEETVEHAILPIIETLKEM